MKGVQKSKKKKKRAGLLFILFIIGLLKLSPIKKRRESSGTNIMCPCVDVANEFVCIYIYICVCVEYVCNKYVICTTHHVLCIIYYIYTEIFIHIYIYIHVHICPHIVGQTRQNIPFHGQFHNPSKPRGTDITPLKNAQHTALPIFLTT